MKTVRVRIAVAVNERGEWHAFGGDFEDDWAMDEAVANVSEDVRVAEHFIEADVPIPEPSTIEGQVTT